MEIKELNQEKYAGRKFSVRYITNGYYDIHAVHSGFQMEYVPIETPIEKSIDDVFFGEWLENPIAYGAFENERLLGYVEGFLEKWNNRFRISNIHLFRSEMRHQGIGTLLMDTILKEAVSSGARMVVLETQSCNENAIAFYRRNGFEIIGFDLYSYSNMDIEQHEIRIEMGKKLA